MDFFLLSLLLPSLKGFFNACSALILALSRPLPLPTVPSPGKPGVGREKSGLIKCACGGKARNQGDLWWGSRQEKGEVAQLAGAEYKSWNSDRATDELLSLRDEKEKSESDSNLPAGRQNSTERKKGRTSSSQTLRFQWKLGKIGLTMQADSQSSFSQNTLSILGPQLEAFWKGWALFSSWTSWYTQKPVYTQISGPPKKTLYWQTGQGNM